MANTEGSPRTDAGARAAQGGAEAGRKPGGTADKAARGGAAGAPEAVKGAASDAASGMAGGDRDADGAGREKAGEMAEGLASLVRGNPIPALLLGVGLGFLLGRTLGKR